MNWISVKDRLPDSTKPCLVLCNGADYRGGPICIVAEHEGGDLWSRDDGDLLDVVVTHWMPLPEPPAEVSP